MTTLYPRRSHCCTLSSIVHPTFDSELHPGHNVRPVPAHTSHGFFATFDSELHPGHNVRPVPAHTSHGFFVNPP